MVSRTSFLLRAVRSCSTTPSLLLSSSGEVTRTSSAAWELLRTRPSAIVPSRNDKLKMFSTSDVPPPKTEDDDHEPEPIPGVGKWKTSTGLVGLAVDHNWYENMTNKYQALLDRIAESDMPETAYYREVVEKIARYRLKAARDNPEDPDMVEELCNCGQVEELIQQADDEMIVLEMYLRERMWELVEEYNKDHETIVDFGPPDSEVEHDAVDWQKEEAFGEKYIKMKEEAEYRAKKRH